MTPKYIIVHHSATKDDGFANNTAAIRHWHVDVLGYRDVAYHALIESIGGTVEILIGRPWDMDGAHTLGYNDTALGVCIIGNFNIEAPDDAHLTAAARIIRLWMGLYSIPAENVFPHKNVNATECPGKFFDMGKLKELLA